MQKPTVTKVFDIITPDKAAFRNQTHLSLIITTQDKAAFRNQSHLSLVTTTPDIRALI